MRLASLLWHGKPRLGLAIDEKILILNELAKADPVRWQALAGAGDVSPLWTESSRKLIAETYAHVMACGIPSNWEPFCERLENCRWLPPVATPASPNDIYDFCPLRPRRSSRIAF